MHALVRRLRPLAFSAAAASAALAASSPRTAVDLSLGAAFGFDDNVYLINRGALSDRRSGFSSVTAKISAQPAAGVTIAYSPTATTYWDESTENNVKQIISAAWKRSVDSFSWNAATEFAFVNGDDRGLNYGPPCNAFSTAVPRERRDQWQNRSDLSLRQDTPIGFVRAVGKLQYWDMLTAPVAGVNYVDRYDLGGGLDIGRAIGEKGPELYLGYRRGHQFQDNDFNPASLKNASNDYDRYLVGVDGKFGGGVTLAAQGGWAVHHYSDNPAVYAGNKREEGLFTDLTLTWAATPADELQAKICQARTFSTTGTNSVLATTHQLSWKHAFSSRWSTTITGRLSEAEYSPASRDDLDYALAASVTCALDKHWGLTLAASKDWGRNNDEAISSAAGKDREFDRALVSLGVTWKR